MTLIWGKSCRVCGNTANEGDYCERCYERQFPVCEYCDKPIRDGEEKFGNCHKKPCYSNMTKKCCKCGDKADKGFYCKSCYEAEHPPPATVEYSTKGTNANFKIRGNQEIVESAMHSLGQGIADGFTRGRQRYNALSEESIMPPPSEKDNSSRRSYSAKVVFHSQ
ncbi:unnamed protein product [Pocillopora meandrina]|uniref:Uncharacterized protein n=1 Tax=Pocillopora meandrina TaxID=46732 RepID=A0AAU9VQ95_9CNID|nr:unnamed protein product [Pocillopora meandrina]